MGDKMKIAICGAYGKMGSFLMSSLSKEHQCVPIGRKDDLKVVISEMELVMDFTTPQATIEHFKQCVIANKPILIGTTGFSEEELKQIQSESTFARISCALMPNYALGILAIMKQLPYLTTSYNRVSIEEFYPKTKVDLPSGTTKQLKQLMQSYNPNLNIEIICQRIDHCKVTHRLLFENEYETFLLEHRVNDMNSYLAGILMCMDRIVNKVQFLDWKNLGLKED